MKFWKPIVAIAFWGFALDAQEFGVIESYAEYTKCGKTFCVQVSRSYGFLGSSVRDVPLKGVKAKTFKVLHHGYATDGQRVWCGDPVPIGKPAEVRALGEGYYSVRGKLWRGCSAFVMRQGAAMRPVDVVSVTPYKCGLVRVGRAVYGPAELLTEKELRAAGERIILTTRPIEDPATFTVDDSMFGRTGECEGRDSKRAYRVQPHGSITGFLPLQEKRLALSDRYSIVNQLVYFDMMRLEGADAATFQALAGGAYARDRRRVWWNGRIIPGADASTFAVIPAPQLRYARDANFVYHGGRVITGAVPKTFALYDDVHAAYGHDNASVYCYGELLWGADVRTFEIVGEGYARDSKRAYKLCNELAPRDRTDYEKVLARSKKSKKP